LIGFNTRKLFVLICVFVVFTSAFLFVFEVDASPTTGVVRIMPLGDSITFGYSGGEGYRKNLYLDLINSGFNVDFVGSQKNGTGFDNDNEGHVGYYAYQIRDNVYGWLVSNPADFVLLHIGTNDIEGQDVAGIVSEVRGILDNIDQWESFSGESVTVVLARIILRSDSASLNTTTKAYDDALETMALARIASGDRIIIVDMENALRYPDDLIQDGIHPASSGYEKMTVVWYNALINILGYSLTVNYIGHGVVTKLPDQVSYPYGTVINLAAKADDGWTFNAWNGDLVGSVNPESITMDGNKTVTATFTQQYKLTVTANYGTTTPSVGDYWYLAGTPVTVEASPPSAVTGVQYVCLGWSGTGSVPASGSTTTSSFTVNASSSITWTWKTQYYLTVSSAYGSAGGSGWYDAATSAYATISSTTVTGSNGLQYTFSGWSGDASGSSSSSNAIVIDAPKTAIANWSPAPVTTPMPTAAPTAVPTVHPTTSPFPSPSPTVSPSPTPAVGPSATPSQPPSGINTSAIYAYALAFGVVLACAIAGILAFRRIKKIS
jgi:uncharacterized repeat protein (TIGR02543 family)